MHPFPTTVLSDGQVDTDVIKLQYFIGKIAVDAKWCAYGGSISSTGRCFFLHLHRIGHEAEILHWHPIQSNSILKSRRLSPPLRAAIFLSGVL
jgi:hypothetical protein